MSIGENYVGKLTPMRSNISRFSRGTIREALDRAREAAAGMDVRIDGGPDTIQQYLREGLIDELHIAIAPVLLGRGGTAVRRG